MLREAVDARREWSWRTSRSSAAGARRGPDQAELVAQRRAITAPVSSKRAITDGVSQSRSTALGDVRATVGRAAPQSSATARGVDVEADAAGPDQAAAEAAAAEQRGHVEEVAADPAAVRRGRQEADVAGERAEVAGVVGQALEFQRDAAQAPGRAAARRSRPAPRRAWQ